MANLIIRLEPGIHPALGHSGTLYSHNVHISASISLFIELNI